MLATGLSVEFGSVVATVCSTAASEIVRGVVFTAGRVDGMVLVGGDGAVAVAVSVGHEDSVTEGAEETGADATWVETDVGAATGQGAGAVGT